MMMCTCHLLKPTCRNPVCSKSKGHKKDTYLRDDTFEDFEDLEKVYGQNIAKGNNTVGTYKKTLTMKLRCFEVKWL
ncbi:hypothetical protein YC2023_118669 [Brassica napus]|uniref:(rape) hypothetical protein n=1 Tax=Brassica napus TaxID=3708 RepID=A0A816I612_BRANA|nr:unnamed protein product [Brassica napus]